MIKIDGFAYKIGVQELRRKVRFGDYFSEMTEDGVLQVARYGTYIDYDLVLAPAFLPLATYEDFFARISAPIAFHNVEVDIPVRGITPLVAKFENINDSAVFITPFSAFWDSLTIGLVAREPARRA